MPLVIHDLASGDRLVDWSSMTGVTTGTARNCGSRNVKNFHVVVSGTATCSIYGSADNAATFPTDWVLLGTATGTTAVQDTFPWHFVRPTVTGTGNVDIHLSMGSTFSQDAIP